MDLLGDDFRNMSVYSVVFLACGFTLMRQSTVPLLNSTHFLRENGLGERLFSLPDIISTCFLYLAFRKNSIIFYLKVDSSYFYAPLVSAVTCSMSVCRLIETYWKIGFFWETAAGKCFFFFVFSVSTSDTCSCACLRSRLDTFHWFFLRECGLRILRFVLISLFRAVLHCTRWCLPRSRLENVHDDALCVDVRTLMRWA